MGDPLLLGATHLICTYDPTIVVCGAKG